MINWEAYAEQVVKERDEARDQLAALDKEHQRVIALADRCSHEIGNLTDQLAEVTARVGVLETALRRITQIGETRDVRVAESALANPSPLASAVGRVVGAALNARYGNSDEPEVEVAVDALRALAPWWPS